MIPVIDIGSLFETTQRARMLADHALFRAAQQTGFVCIKGLPPDAARSGLRGDLPRIFSLDEDAKRRLYRRKFAPENRNVYRGWFPLQPGNLTHKEGIDLGGDIAHGPEMASSRDPLREPSAVPAEPSLPGWRAAAAAYYGAMERLAQTLMRSIARSLLLPEAYFDDFFRRGLSTLRVIRYPPRETTARATAEDPSRCLVGAPHTDSGFLTLLEQDDVGGLQARSADGHWLDVTPIADSLVVNFGQVLEQWSARRIRATSHRVVGQGIERLSIAFFYEARADATIAPLPFDPPDAFVPFQYGDFLWKRITSFVEFQGMEDERVRAGH